MGDAEPPYRGGCRPGMPYPSDERPACHRGCLHRVMVEAYYDQRDARDALRESDQPVPPQWAYGSGATYSQLEDEDFDAAVPRVTFREWLKSYWGERTEDVA